MTDMTAAGVLLLVPGLIGRIAPIVMLTRCTCLGRLTGLL
jgi:UPF0716 family protein affecting phage T7 exclusion